jgi:DNA-binding MarR family transcriptional regulator
MLLGKCSFRYDDLFGTGQNRRHNTHDEQFMTKKPVVERVEQIENRDDITEDFQLANAPGFLFRRLDSLASHLFYRNSAQSEISPRQFGILLTLHETGSINQGELSDLMHIDRSTMGEIIRRMAARGLIDRRTPSADRRRIELILTDLGRRRLAAHAQAAIKVQQELLCAIPAAARPAVLKHLTTILDKFGF